MSLNPLICHRMQRTYMYKGTHLVYYLGLVVRRVHVGNFNQRINPYPADKIGMFLSLIGQRANYIHWIGIYPLDKVIHSSYNWVQNNSDDVCTHIAESYCTCLKHCLETNAKLAHFVQIIMSRNVRNGQMQC